MFSGAQRTIWKNEKINPKEEGNQRQDPEGKGQFKDNKDQKS